jgi:hypothetical protein
LKLLASAFAESPSFRAAPFAAANLGEQRQGEASATQVKMKGKR